MKQNSSINISNWDEHDLENFIKNNSSLFYAFAYRYLKDSSEIEDIMQECYLKLWNERKKIGHLSSPLNYLFTMIKNRALNMLNHNEKMDLGIEKEYCDSTNFLNNIIEAESSQIIADAVSTLSPQSQEVLELVVQGKSLDEIAKELNLSINSVKTVKYRAISRLSQILPRKLFTIFISI